MKKEKFEPTPMQRAILYAGSQVKLSKAIGKSRFYINQVMIGNVPLSIDLAMDIEKATNGAVLREELRPDIFEGFVRVEDEK